MEFATIGTALTSRRKALNIDQARAAAIIGMSRTTFSSYERDLQRPSAEVLPSLAQFLEISIEDILSLYGGTCIAALRPSLEQFLATQGVDGTDRPSGGNATSPSSAPAPSLSSASPASAPEGESSDDPVASASPLDGSDGAVAPRANPIPPDEPATPATAKDASVSIFANELSQDVPRTTALTSPSSDSDGREPKVAKGKDGKKKKGKKGKRAKT